MIHNIKPFYDKWVSPVCLKKHPADILIQQWNLLLTLPGLENEELDFEKTVQIVFDSGHIF